MGFEAQIFWTSKDIDFPEEYQDACYLDPEQGIAAIADGVSSALFSGPWARILTKASVTDPPQFLDTISFLEWLQKQREAWREQVDTSQLTWFQRPKMIDGAMSTLLWLQLTSEADGDAERVDGFCLKSFAIGDCCLFHVRDREVQQVFPISTAADFSLNPDVLGSSSRGHDDQIVFHYLETRCQLGDLIVLCTDAIALWAIARYEAGESVDWNAYWHMTGQQWLDELVGYRQANLIRFDDSTLVLLRPGLGSSIAHVEEKSGLLINSIKPESSEADLESCSDLEKCFSEEATASLEVPQASESEVELKQDGRPEEQLITQCEESNMPPKDDACRSDSSLFRSAARLLGKVAGNAASILRRTRAPLHFTSRM